MPQHPIAETTGGPSGSQPVKRIAVIAVHGVGHAEPNETSAAVANLLTNLDPAPHSGQPLYSCYRATPLRIPLEPARVHQPEQALWEVETRQQKSLLDRIFGSLDERRGYFAEMLRTPENGKTMEEEFRKDQPASRGKFGHEFMRLQLGGYKRHAVRWPPRAGSKAAALPPAPQKPPHSREADEPQPPDESYETLRLELRRNGATPKESPEVHIYEVHWSDLARPVRGVFGIFGALYQLLLHLASLGRTAVDHATFEHASSRQWRGLGWFYVQATRLFTLFIPVVLLYLVLAELVPTLQAYIRHNVIDSTVGIIAILSGAPLGVAATYFFLYRHQLRESPRLWALAPLIGGFAGALAFGGLYRGFGRIPTHYGQEWPSIVGGLILTVIAWGVGSLLIQWLLSSYDNVRAGAIEVGWVAAGLFFLMFLGSLIWAIGKPHWLPRCAIAPSFEIKRSEELVIPRTLHGT